MKYYDVSQWGDSSGQGSPGTREKDILVDPDSGKIYFLKFSLLKPGRDYKTEYWSEIIAYTIGKYLEFNILEYNLAEKNDRFGCISENMVDTESEQLIEGYSILSSCNPSYDPNDKNMRHMYTFSFVCKALNKYGYGRFIPNFIEILIFDSIIGNSDRHQGNWGFIHKRDVPSNENSKSLKSVLKNLIKKSREDVSKDRISPIYDSGCCLGREFSDEVIIKMLNEPESFDRFIRKSQAELRCDDNPRKKVTHFELLRFIMNSNETHKTYIENRINNICDIFEEKKLKNIIENIETEIPERVKSRCKMSDERKQFIIKVITTRINKLKELIENVP